MTDGLRAQLRAVVAQVAAVKEQATALGMQAETLERTVQAMIASLPAEPMRAPAPAPPPSKYFTGPTTAEPATT